MKTRFEVSNACTVTYNSNGDFPVTVHITDGKGVMSEDMTDEVAETMARWILAQIQEKRDADYAAV